MLILLLTVFSLYLCLSQIKYQIQTTTQYYQLIFIEIIYQHLLVQTNMQFLMKIVIHITAQHYIPRIQLFFKELNCVYSQVNSNFLSHFYVEPCKIQKSVTVLIRSVYIANIDIKVWTSISEFPQGDLLIYLKQS